MALITETGSAYYSGSNLGGYQFTDLQTVINQFMLAYVGEEKIIGSVKRPEVVFFAQRALQELSFDTFKSVKALEIDVPPSLQMDLPQDYVNYVKITKSDGDGIEHILYPATKTSNPQKITQGADGSYTFNNNEIQTSSSDTAAGFQTESANDDDYFDGLNYDDDHLLSHVEGGRFGIEPSHAQINGSFYIDELRGKINFSSNAGGANIVLHYISDSLGTDAEMKVHKFAEEAMYKYIAHAVLATKRDTPEYLVERFKREARAAKRQAKLRLSNLKIEEIAQIMRGKSKQIKH
tara:strand:- start:1207 stop:2085 length:879 start_codon:yes stop_codon:yes gene_type:complete